MTAQKVVRFGRPREVIAEFPTHAEAYAAYEALVDGLDPHAAMAYAVRSADDPDWAVRAFGYQGAIETKDYKLALKAQAAARAWRIKEAGQTARAIITGSGAEASLWKVERLVSESLKAREITVDQHTVEYAVKSRVTIGRCRQHGGYWFPKAEGPLHKRRCPECNGWLNQTSLALGTGFKRLPREVVA